MSGKRFRSGKVLELERSDKQQNYLKALNFSKSNMAAAELLEELKSMRLDLTGQITKLSNDLKDFQRNTNERLQKIESVMSKVDEIDGLKTKQQQLEADVDNIKESLLNLVSTNAEEVEALHRNNDELEKRLEHLERYSRDFNIQVLGFNEDKGEECMEIITDLVTSLGFENAAVEIENAHHTRKKRNNKPRPIIIRLYSRPFKRSLLQAAKSPDGKAILQGVRIVEDLTPSDFNAHKKALPLMKQAYDEGKKVRFTKGKLFIDGREIYVA